MKLSRFITFRFSAAIAIIATMAMLCSCSKESQLVKYIPADSSFVVKINGNQILENAGCSLSGDKITLSDDLETLISDNNLKLEANTVISIAETLDLSEILIYSIDNRDGVAVAAIANEGRLNDRLSSFLGRPETLSGFTVYSHNHTVVALKDGFIWLSDSFNIIKESVDMAKRKHIGTIPGIEEFIAADNAIAVCGLLDSSFEVPLLRNSWICGSMKLDNQTLSGRIVAMDRDGKLVNIGESFDEIDTDFLRYVPADFNLVMGVGNVNNAALRTLISAYALSSYNRSLGDFDGTIGLALDVNPLVDRLIAQKRTPDYNEVMSLLKYIAMAHFPAKSRSEVIDLCQMVLGGNEIAKGVYSSNILDIPYYYGELDGNIFVSSFRPEADGNNPFYNMVEGHRIALAGISSPTEQTRSIGIDFGGKSAIWLDLDNVGFESKITGTDRKILEAVIHLFTQPEFLSYVRQHSPRNSYHSGNYYDEDELYDYFE